MYRIGKYQIKPFTKHRKNISLMVHEGWRKHAVHATLDVDVTDARKIIRDISKKTGHKISFTGWVVRCAGFAISRHKNLNSYRHGKSKIFVFDDVDVGIPIEQTVDGEKQPFAYIIRRANEKSVWEISNEIRQAQESKADASKPLLGKMTRFEKFVVNSPVFLQKIMLRVVRKNAVFRKKYTGTVGVTSIGMIGRFPGGVIPLGATSAVLIVLGGISKKPGVVNNKIMVREYLHVTVTVDHDLVDGGPLARFIETFVDLLENAFELVD